MDSINLEKNLSDIPELKSVFFDLDIDQLAIKKMLQSGELATIEKDIFLEDLIAENYFFNFPNGMQLEKDPNDFFHLLKNNYSYYLYISRPFEALENVLQNESLVLFSKDLTISQEKSNEIYRKTFTIALNRPFDKSCVAGCIVFLELLGYDTRLFKVK